MTGYHYKNEIDRKLASMRKSYALYREGVFIERNDISRSITRLSGELIQNGDAEEIHEVIKSLIFSLKESIEDKDMGTCVACEASRKTIGDSAVLQLINTLREGNDYTQKVILEILTSVTGKRFIFGKANPNKWQAWWNKKGVN